MRAMFLCDFARLQPNPPRAVIHRKEKQNAREQIESKWMQIAHPFAGEEFVRELPGLDDKQTESGEKFRIPVQKRIQNIDNYVPERATIIDRRLAALRAMRSN